MSVGEGVTRFTDTCDATGITTNWLEISYGSITQGGFPVVPTPIGIPSQIYIDIATNYSALLPGPIPLPLVGAVGPTEHLASLNL